MLSRKKLSALARVPESMLTVEELAGKRSAESRGLPYYGKLRKEFPTHFTSFAKIHYRTKLSGLACDFPRTVEGFIEFLLYIGDVPDDQLWPTVGRFDHSKGYICGNFAWQDQDENSGESVARNNPSQFALKGEDDPKAVLTEELVRRIRKFRDAKLKEGWKKRPIAEYVQKRLTEKLGIVLSIGTIRCVVDDRTWKHLL